MKLNSCCSIEAIVSFDERGQLVIPKDVRRRFNLNPGDKFALISCTDEKDQTHCCFTLMKTKQMNKIVQECLTPIMKTVL